MDVVGHREVSAISGPGEHDVQQPRQLGVRRLLVAVVLVGLKQQDRGVGLPTFCLMQVHNLHVVWAKPGVAKQRTVPSAV